MSETESDTYGLMAEFETPEELLEAAKLAYGKGYRTMDAYSPLPIHGLAAAIGFHRTNLPILTFILALTGAIVGYGMQYWIQVIDFPVNIGGRPLHSGPMFIPVTFELTILFAAVGTFVGLWIRNGLPMPYHPVFGGSQEVQPESGRPSTGTHLRYTGSIWSTRLSPGTPTHFLM